MHEQFAAILRVMRELVLSLIILGACVLCGYILRKILFQRLTAWAKTTKSKIDDIVISSVRGRFMIWFLLIGLSLGLEASHFPDNVVSIIQKVLLVLTILSITAVIASMAVKLVRVYGAGGDEARPITSLTEHVSRVLIMVIGLLIILNAVGVSITPFLAALGVGGLAVSLALKDTLANIIAGFHILASKQIRIGDYVKLESGQEGCVSDIHWRTTKIRTLANNVVLVPNDKLAEQVITNYSLPDNAMSVSIDLTVHHSSDLRRVEEVTCDEARRAMEEVVGGGAGSEPSIRYHTFAESGIRFSVNLQVRGFTDQYSVKHEFIKRLHERYRREGIVTPYPVTAVNYDQEKRQ